MRCYALSLLLLFCTVISYSQVGIGTTDPKASLHVSGDASNSQVVDGVILPKLTRAQLIAKSGLYGSNQTGTLLFLTDASGTANASTALITEPGFYYFDGSVWKPLKGTAVPMVDASSNGFPSNVIVGIPVSNMVFKVTVTNNSFSNATLAFQNSDLALSGVTGLSVSSTSPSSATLIAGQSVEVSYTIVGTPATTGTLTATWTKLSLTTSAYKEVTTVAQALNDNNYTSSAMLNYLFVKDVAVGTNNTFTVTFTNNSSGSITGLAAPSTSNLVLSGSGSSGLSVASVSPSGAYNLAAGASKTFTYTLSGTPTSVGTLNVAWTYYDLSASASKTVVQLKASGGTVAIYQSGNNFYAYHKFNSSGNLTVNEATSMNYLIVGGGGAGGKNHGGGGGAGGVLQGSFSTTTTIYPVVVGAGGSGQAPGYNVRGASGSPSSIFSFTALGGGGGGGRNDTNNTDLPSSGASGGGGEGNNPPTAAISISTSQGNNGGAGSTDATAGNGGGGGGAGAAGGAGSGAAYNGITGSGGIGIQSAITGVNTYYAGGGSGGRWQTGLVGAPGLGGGGTGGAADYAAGSAGTANTGGGGGGGGGGFGLGGAGGSGVVIVSYQLQ